MVSYRLAKICVAVIFVTTCHREVQSSLVTFSDRAAFLAAANATAATTIPTTPAIAFSPDIGFTSGSLSFSLVGSHSSRFSIGNFSDRLIDNELALSGNETFNVVIAGAPVVAFGFDFVEPEFDPGVNAAFEESTHEVTLLNGATTVGSFVFQRPNDSAQFVGVWVDQTLAFDKVLVFETSAEAGDIGENEFFGQFFTGTQSMVPGDANGDGCVSGADFTIWNDNFGAGPGATSAMGDFTGDGFVTGGDFTVWADHFGEGCAPAQAVPEPAGWMMFATAAVVLCAATRRHSLGTRHRH